MQGCPRNGLTAWNSTPHNRSRSRSLRRLQPSSKVTPLPSPPPLPKPFQTCHQPTASSLPAACHGPSPPPPPPYYCYPCRQVVSPRNHMVFTPLLAR